MLLKNHCGVNDLLWWHLAPSEAGLTMFITFSCVRFQPDLIHTTLTPKSSRFNELLVERYLDTEEWITVIDTIPPEIRYHNHDGLHMSHLGVTKLCCIVMSNLYKIIAPMSHRKCSHSKSNHRASRR